MYHLWSWNIIFFIHCILDNRSHLQYKASVGSVFCIVTQILYEIHEENLPNNVWNMSSELTCFGTKLWGPSVYPC